MGVIDTIRTRLRCWWFGHPCRWTAGGLWCPRCDRFLAGPDGGRRR